ncbi:tRNA pseudouridine synthase C [Bacteroidales bacterium Barb7]|nr:tRNA pseudouridine synthase C [Bacteroidales bacterium Barb7]
MPLEIDLKTGCHHQIRAQLAKAGSPIKGDLKYGFDRSNKDGGISLHARKAEFIHPVSKQLVVITAVVFSPMRFGGGVFAACLGK